MSSDADAAAATAALFVSVYPEQYCTLAASVLVTYDALTTFDREVAFFWTTKRTGASFIFFANRWISMAYYVMSLVGFASFPSDKIANAAIIVLQFVPGAAFSALRAYVLSQNKVIGILVLVLSLAPVGSNLVAFDYQVSGVTIPPFGCLEIDNTTEAIVTVISRVPLIVADIVLICITWAKLSCRGNLMGISQSKRMSLSDILFRNGTIYFIVLFMLNTLHLILSITALAVEEGNGSSYVTIFTGPLTSILISRFLLDLQEVSEAVVRVDRDDPLYTSRNLWNDSPSAMSSLGAFIDPDHPARSGNDMEWDVDSPLDGEEDRSPQVSEVHAAKPLSSPTAEPLPSSGAAPSSAFV